jgi:multidrug efflux pump subunit AcrB
MLASIVRHGTLIAVIVLIVCVLGVAAALRVPVQMIPDLDVRSITIRTSWPGATPQDVEKEILIEQEEYLRTIPNLERLLATATFGQGRVELEFPFGIDVNEALIRTQNALAQVPSYPENVDEPRIFASSFSENSFMFFRIAPLPGNPRGLDMDMMLDFIVDNVRTRLERVPGVSQVDVNGGAERQVQIIVDPARLAERRVTLNEVRGAIRARNRDASGGDIDSGKRRYLVRTVGRYDSLAAIEDTVIAMRGDTMIRLRDVAEVRLDHFEVRTQSYVDGERSIGVSFRREPGSNVIEIKREVLPVIEELNRNVLEPAGMRMAPITDDVRYVEASVANVWKNLALGAVLATLVMYLFLRSVRLTLVGVVGIPICTIAAFLGLLAAGRTINVISLAGIAFAIGMTLDNSIVVLESIERERRRGLAALDAAIAGVRRVWPAVLASTMTTVLVFAPVLFVEEEAGQLYSDVAVAISASILASMLVAIAVIPTAVARLSSGGAQVGEGRGEHWRQRLLGLTRWLSATPLRRTACVAGTLLGTGLAIWALTPPAEYLPEGEEAKTFSLMIAPPGYNLDEMIRIGEEVQARFLPYLDDDPDEFASGRTDVPALMYFNMWVQPQSLRAIVEPKNPAHIEPLMEVLNERFSGYPGMRAFSSRGSIISSNDGGTRSVNVELSGADLATLYEAATRVIERAEEVLEDPQVRSEPGSLSLAQPLVELVPRWDRAAELGFTASELGYAIGALTDGAYVDEYFEGDDKIDMFLYSAAGQAQDLARIAELPIYAPVGQVVPVSAVADLVETVDTDTIRRVDGRRTVTVYIIPPRSIALETAIDRVRADVLSALASEGALPRGVSYDITGAGDQLDATRESLSGNFGIALILCYLVLVAIFTHWGYPLVILTAVPLGIAGGIIGLAVLNFGGSLLPLVGAAAISQPFDMITMLGFLILVGIVVNNPILIVDRALSNVRVEGMEAEAAVAEAVEARIRPIMMSMITTVFGLAPLVFLPGAGTELYRGVGAIVLFGLLFATLVTLTFLPSLLVMILKRGERRRARATARVATT